MVAEEILTAPTDILPVVNVASVPQRSPFRYPGGKTWLIPVVRRWLRSYERQPRMLIEPFAGGAIVSLTAVFEDLVAKAELVELDRDIASVWQTILLGHGEWLAQRISTFRLSDMSVAEALAHRDRSVREHAFATILRNRISRGGILAPGAGVVKNGENGRGIASRWYPQTLSRRIMDIVSLRHRLFAAQGDGIAYMQAESGTRDTVFFIDPPYVKAGRRLYTHSDVDHAQLFRVAAGLRGDFLMTYDAAPEIRSLAARHSFEVREIPMKTTHHTMKTELLIARDFSWIGHPCP